MKLLLKKAFAAFAVLFGVTSCMDDILGPGELPEEGMVAYTAYVDGTDTKTSLESNVTMWEGEEWIQIVGRKGNYWFNANVSSPSSSAVFSYNGDNGEYNEKDVMAVYPAGSVSYGKDFTDMKVYNVTVPSDQTPVIGSYDPAAAVAVAYTDNDKLHFKNAVALLKFTIGSDNVRNVTVYGDVPESEEVQVQEGVIYLKPNSNWKDAGARFAAYFFGNGETWSDMTLVAGQTDVYQCTVPTGFANVIFVRMNPATTANNWDNKWDQTKDLKVQSPGTNLFTVTEGQWNNATGSWGSFKDKARNGISGTGTLAYNGGNPIITGASNNYVSMTGTFIKGCTYYMAIAPVVFENGFTMEFSNSGNSDKYPVRSTSKRVEFKRNTIYNLGTIMSGKDTGFFADPGIPDADGGCTIYFRPEEGSEFDGYDSDLYAHVWLKHPDGSDISGCGSSWGDNSEKYKLAKVGDNLWSMTISPSIRSWFSSGTHPLQRIGILARTAAKDRQTDDYFIKVTDRLYGMTFPLPEGVQHGINYIDNSTVTLVLYDRDNQGRSHDFCNLLWDDNWWGDSSKPKKPLYYDDESGCWWITLTGLNPDRQYKFQYQLGYGSTVTVTTFDPYTEIVYDRSNDQWISSSTYPNLSQEYGDTHYGRDNGFISAFKINRDVYDWKVKDYDIEDKNDLIIYELHLRDFTDNAYGEGSVKAAMAKLDYLKTLGVNAIELMPVQEFDGNDSWGYGNHAYFALDKAYGTRKDYKAFIDACHQRGMAVIFDVVYNHATGAHPYAAMYWDGTANKTASNNPWFNVDAPHGWSVFHDWNHSNPMVREHVRRSLTYLMTEYKVDGFRFDLTKGFTQTGGESYDQNRVDWLKEYNAHIQSVDSDAVMICEHFVDDENYELGKAGIKVWRNMNYSYSKAMKRDMSVADFSGTTNGFNDNGTMAEWDHFGMFVGYQESHDEERTNYEGQWDYTGAEIDFATRMERAKINAAFFLLSPGPKMIWQYGELGYDYSLFYDRDSGTVIKDDGTKMKKKPYVADSYLAVKERKALYDTYCSLLAFRKKNHRCFDSDVNFRWKVGSGNQVGRYAYVKDGDGRQFVLFGNFGKGTQTISVTLPSGGDWYQYDNPAAVWSGSSHSTTMAEGQFYILVSDKSMCL